MHKTMVVETPLADSLDNDCQTIGDVKSGTVLFDREVTFDDGHRMAIQVIAARGDCAWTQGVLFAPDGQEVGYTEVMPAFLATYTVKVDDQTYTVDVKSDTEE
jgi:hypothetical protein